MKKLLAWAAMVAALLIPCALHAQPTPVNIPYAPVYPIGNGQVMTWNSSLNAWTNTTAGMDVGNNITFTGGSSLTDNGSGQLTIATANNNNLILNPGSGAVVIPTNASSFEMYNANDGSGNTEYGSASWIANVFTIRSNITGSGTARSVQIGSSGNFASIKLNPSSSTPAGQVNITGSATASTIGGLLGLTGYSSTATSGTSIGIGFYPTYNQASGNAANTDFLINRTETAVGSGNQYFVDFQVGGSTKWHVDHAGAVTQQSGIFVSNGTASNPSYGFANATTTGLSWLNPGIGFSVAASSVGTWTATALNTVAALTVGTTLTSYNGVATAGNGIPVIRAQANITAQSSNATIVSYANPAADGDYEVSAQLSVTASTTLATTITVTYTDAANVGRTMIMPVQPSTGTFVAAGAITGAGASIWETPIMHIRVKASTTITILTSAGTFTGVTYSASGVIKKTS